MLNALLAVISAYIIGSMPTSYIVARSKGIDIRKKGSGNVGATNVMRVIGKGPAVFVLAVDILKGAIAVTVLAQFFYDRGTPFDINMLKSILGLSVISGHVWSVFLGFKGGKGVATSIGVMALLLPKATIAGLIVFLLATWKSKYVSVGSLMLCLTIPPVAAFMGKPLEYIVLSITVCIIVSYRHKSNIKRLFTGNEAKISEKLS